MNNKLFEIFEKTWNDPVWSKVISVLIISLLTLVFNFIVSKYRRKRFKQVFVGFWKSKFELWLYVLFLLILFVLIFKFPEFGFWNYVISLVIGFVFYYLFSSKSKNGTSTSGSYENKDSTILFNSELSKPFHFVGTEEFIWENDKAVGEKANGKFVFDKRILNIERKNTAGRYILVISAYITDDQNKSYIKKDISKRERIIGLQFESKIIGGPHSLRFTAKDPVSRKWIHKASVNIPINNTEWKDYTAHIRIPGGEDFIITIDDIEVEKAPSSIQIRKLIITEEF